MDLIIKCSSCGANNRVLPYTRDIARCEKCNSFLIAGTRADERFVSGVVRTLKSRSSFVFVALLILAVIAWSLTYSRQTESLPSFELLSAISLPYSLSSVDQFSKTFINYNGLILLILISIVASVFFYGINGRTLRDTYFWWIVNALLGVIFIKKLIISLYGYSLYEKEFELTYKLLGGIVIALGVFKLIGFAIKKSRRSSQANFKRPGALWGSGRTEDENNTCGFCKCHVNDGAIQCYHCGATLVINNLKWVLILVGIGIMVVALNAVFQFVPYNELYANNLEFRAQAGVQGIFGCFLFVVGLFLPSTVWVRKIGW